MSEATKANTSSIMEMANSNAVDKVFNTFELLEKILVNELPNNPRHSAWSRMIQLKDLHRLQRVNSTFRDVLIRSKTLQVGMFRAQRIENNSQDRADQLYTCEELKLGLNPVLEYFHHFFYGLKYCYYEFLRKQPCADVAFMAVARDVVYQTKAWAGVSWRHMLFANISLRANMIVKVQEESETLVPSREIELGEGVTLGEVADEIVKAVEDIEEAQAPS